MGVTWQEFWGMNPHIINCIRKGHEERIKQEDYLQYVWWGNYGLSAVYVAIEHYFNGGKANSKYIDKPVFLREEAENHCKESNEEVAVFEMKKRIETLKKQGLPESPM